MNTHANQSADPGAQLDSAPLARAPTSQQAEITFSCLDDLSGLKQFFLREGYAVVHNVVPKALCAQATRAFEQQVKPSQDYFIRHESGRFEQHVFTEHGFMKYPIMNIQDLTARRYADFTRLGLEILTNENIRAIMRELFDEPGRAIHTMYFDGNQRTWPHRDSHYIDAEKIGQMVGVWVAAEDIHAGAGRFYIYGGSHRLSTPAAFGLDNMDPNSREYKEATGKFAAASGLPLVAPALEQGDVILWSSLTIHGSLETTEPSRSRKSFTAHYVPQSQHFLDLRKHRGSDRYLLFNGVRVTRHQDQSRWSTQMKASLRAFVKRHPWLLSPLKKVKGWFRRPAP
jgi:phytanoyl-CoA hydroxylase